jgi:hypothetical protein
MEDVTLIIQGRILQDTYDFYIKNYKDFPVIISTWVDNKVNFENMPDNFKVVISQYPKDRGAQNLHLQLLSTLSALDLVRTNFVIKMRGDEYYSNIHLLEPFIKQNKNKVVASPIFFRPWVYAEYHISDHVICGTTENMKIMFSETKKHFDGGTMNQSKWKIDGKFHKWIETHSPEERITKCYLNAKEPFRYNKVDGRILMMEHFDIFDLDVLKPYLIKANLYKNTYTEFIPERNFSISTMEQMFWDDPYTLKDKK